MIVTTDHGAVRELRLDRPPANALVPELLDALRDGVSRAPEEGVRAVILSGRPGRFSGGLDVPHLLTLDRARIEGLWESFYGLLRALASSPIPVGAAITGHSPAGGAVISIFCDHRVMAEGDFKIGLNEVQVGMPVPPIIHDVLVRLVGPRQAERLAVGSQLVSSAEALRIGLVDELAPPDQVIDKALEWANWLISLPPVALSRTRSLARADLIRIVEAHMQGETAMLVEDWFSDETQASMSAVAERLTKRKG